MPLDVHKLYKSTATGQITKSGVGDSPFKALKWPLIFGVGLLSIMALYNLLLSGSASTEQTTTAGNQTAKKGIEIEQSGTIKSADMASLADSVKTDPKTAIDIALPYRGKEIYLVGTERITENGEFKEWLLYFECKRPVKHTCHP